MAKRNPLATYRAKRDFSITAEPSGEHPVTRSGRLRYVIQKHAATRLHYDLRLELDGVFKSWAVTRGPSVDPRDKRLAVEVEDHPLDYGDFEGTIPKGQYGGGTVQLWDRGYWSPEGPKSAREGLEHGELKFALEGERLHGSWVLVRIRNDRSGSKRTNWLLIKHRDAHAQGEETATALLAEDRSIASGRPMALIAAGKGRGPRPFMLEGKAAADPAAVWNSNRGDAADDRARLRHAPRLQIVAGKTAAAKSKQKLQPKQKSQPKLPEFIAPQLCQIVAHPPPGAGWAHEIKLDGYRMQLRIENGAATLKTRKGLDWTSKFGAIAAAAAQLPDAIIDGEIVALDHDGAPDFSALQAALSEGRDEKLIYYAFDLLIEDGGDLRDEPLRARKQRLQALLAARNGEPRIRFVEHFETAGDAVLRSACKMSLEGIVSKKLDARYQSGRNGSWTKAKCRAGHEVVIGGWSTTAGRFRSLLIGVYRGKQFVYVGRVGTGYGGEKLKSLLPRLQAAETRASPFTGVGAPRHAPGVHWVVPDLVVEIEFAGWTAEGMVRQAAYKGLREDKPASEVQAEEPAAPSAIELPRPGKARASSKHSARKSSAAKSASRTPIVMGVTLSNPDKALWPADEGSEAISKLDLARYYAEVGAWMIEHLRGRPCSIIRAPNGYRGEHFFQRHAMAGSSSLLTLVPVTGIEKPYLQVDRVEGLVALAQIAALELHPWNCQPGEPDTPGRLVFDLDPAPDVEFSAVIEAAKEVRSRLADLGLIGFCKTTGGKGLHVVTPLGGGGKRRPTWKEAKQFAHDVCIQMAGDSPQLYLVNMAKKLRTGRIYLDYLRNDRMATAVAPLSPRARPQAPISMPIAWTQVKPGLDPMRYTLSTVPALLRKSKAWTQYCDAERPLHEAIARLGRVRASA